MTSTNPDRPFRLWQRPGWGSAIVEAQLAFHDLPVELIEVGDLLRDGAARDALAPVNPLGQVPVLELPSGEVMTESAAITLHLADLARSDALVPGPDATERAAFLRWLVFIVANIYPTFTYADVPGRFVPDPAAAEAFRRQVERYAEGLWLQFSAAAKAPWVLGERFSALDLYVAVMTRWRPGRPWFEGHAPRLADIADRVAGLPRIGPVLVRNFPA